MVSLKITVQEAHVEIPAGVTEIGGYAFFAGCSSLGVGGDT